MTKTTRTNSTGSTVGVTISNSTASNNNSYGMLFSSNTAALTATVDSSYASNNTFGINGYGTAQILLSRSTITSNTYGIVNSTSPNKFYTYRDNRINENGTDIYNALNTSLTLQ
jgi:hypothetical protein